ncbi:YgdI/YgdR family lipoprotein [Pectobacteriaceae bacterium CE70]|uniref:YgdI/YgdR family lipoprotein n=1 Tax=Serratia sp. (strain ATCC 39006) TaxID=104623 RepID=A0A2I5TNJ3_SERS3|nr:MULTISPECIES: YgdI/YgdR family lipoprotein [Enterobacterales]WJV63570.1 YgdI/YgdR family lipoprotein [Pectobacteriaceae bacterium C52]WJV67959.1 YgdI/YgdR family lipoprotein [Pectobacteriaceae bacterium CE70]WJY11903.1 YgdI/YgdR family lipoprotein [Pectobacteriaceae bacterium C80]AUH01809.1 YgdI/YgdR family lipoprotein [Serratia sp. ATCC 39006]AUH06132.1 YgdI/YgdR family lipoprotein [Serratia sp. ATCC 39006]
MKNNILILAVVMMAFSMAACSSNYVMHTHDGRDIVAQGKPKVDDETGMIKYKDAEGNEQQINRSDIEQMSEAK